MNITLDLLISHDACEAGKRFFVEKFSETGSPEARDVFVALANENHGEWINWCVSNIEGFLETVGNISVGNYQCAISGDVVVKIGVAYLTGNASAYLTGNASAYLFGNASAKLYDNASAKLYDNASAKLYDNASAKLYDNATLLIFNYSFCAHVKFELNSKQACAIDRRGDGLPKMITLSGGEDNS